MNREVDDIVQRIAGTFPTFGGGRVSSMPSPLSLWCKDDPLMFALGVDVAAVVEFVLSFRAGSHRETTERQSTTDAVRGGQR